MATILKTLSGKILNRDLHWRALKFQFDVLRGLQAKPSYQGTVELKEKKRRRAADKVAKHSRKINRK